MGITYSELKIHTINNDIDLKQQHDLNNNNNDNNNKKNISSSSSNGDDDNTSIKNIKEAHKSIIKMERKKAETKLKETKEIVVEPILALLASADIESGQKISKKCVACHGFDAGGANKVGPNLYNIVNRAKMNFSS